MPSYNEYIYLFNDLTFLSLQISNKYGSVTVLKQ
jgi:hypothetical protein